MKSFESQDHGYQCCLDCRRYGCQYQELCEGKDRHLQTQSNDHKLITNHQTNRFRGDLRFRIWTSNISDVREMDTKQSNTKGGGLNM